MGALWIDIDRVSNFFFVITPICLYIIAYFQLFISLGYKHINLQDYKRREYVHLNAQSVFGGMPYSQLILDVCTMNKLLTELEHIHWTETH